MTLKGPTPEGWRLILIGIGLERELVAAVFSVGEAVTVAMLLIVASSIAVDRI